MESVLWPWTTLCEIDGAVQLQTTHVKPKMDPRSPTKATKLTRVAALGFAVASGARDNNGRSRGLRFKPRAMLEVGVAQPPQEPRQVMGTLRECFRLLGSASGATPSTAAETSSTS